MAAPLFPPLAELYARAPRGIELGLGPIAEACQKIGHPERSARLTAHVAGTNGKGSVASMLESIARHAGHRTGLYTSPHLCRFAERIRIDGAPLDDQRLAQVLGSALALEPPLTFFEAATLAAFLAFRDAGVTAQVIEVGLGGRLDATNVLVSPTVSVITRIDFDHEDRLGHTLAAIAGEKAGIAKPGVPMVVGDVGDEAKEAILQAAARVSAPVLFAADDSSANALGAANLLLAGAHQHGNATIAACAARVMGFSDDQIARGLSLAEWPGRLELVSARGRRFLLDAAHNPDGARSLAAHLTSIGGADMLVFGALADKAWPAMLPILAPFARSRVYVPPQGRAPAPTALLQKIAPGEAVGSVSEALEHAVRHTPEGALIVVSGSMYLVGEARSELLGLPRDPPVAL
jgi:dihydrofolate synthase/folylpolyglutamate synthase